MPYRLKLGSFALISALAFSACENTDDDKDPVASNPILSDTVIVGPFTSKVELSASKTYLLKGFASIEDGGELVIPAGTVVKGDFVTRGTLIVKRGGKLTVNGTASSPVVFTSKQDAGKRNRADWGGIIINGKSSNNLPGGTGISEGNGGPHGGGTSPVADDNSGSIRYLRIEYGGTKVSPDNEVNGLTMNSVGSGTTIEYVQAHMIADDGFEWFGGTVNAKYLVSSGNDDDAFDIDNGFSGKLQFIFGIQDPALANRGHEVDNDATGSTATPVTKPTIWNATIVGAYSAGATSVKANDDDNDGLYFRRNSSGLMSNYIVTNFRGYGFNIDGSASKTNAVNGNLYVKNSILFNNKVGLTKGGYEVSFKGDTTGVASLISTWNIKVQDPGLASIDFENPNPVPAALVTGGTPSGTSLDPSATYMGAFGTTNWLTGWTNFKKK
ncbi:MAG: T9SS C-terminal target domain-containing protein [Bacteroidetes bacterium]|nr:T9SS C-terminal target domain-containing protein [Bacteroidota bacterium]